jgi:hypothetical protein
MNSYNRLQDVKRLKFGDLSSVAFKTAIAKASSEYKKLIVIKCIWWKNGRKPEFLLICRQQVPRFINKGALKNDVTGMAVSQSLVHMK